MILLYTGIMKKILGVQLALLIIINIQPAAPQAMAENYFLQCSWLKTPITVDGKETTIEEWSDASTYIITLGIDGGVNPPYLRTKIWVKNDQENLYILMKIAYLDKIQGDEEDQAFLYYFWPTIAGTDWDQSDAAWLYQLGSPTDLTNYDGNTWQQDIYATPPGENNVQGIGNHDTMFYWFEAVKPLDSGDIWDWSLEPGDTIGAGNMEQTSDLLYIGLRDDSKGQNIETRMTLMLAEQPDDNHPVGGTLEKTYKTSRLAIALSFTLFAAYAYKLVRPRK
jgi:hypothetical protein